MREDSLLNPLRHVKHGAVSSARRGLLVICEAIVKRRAGSTVVSGPFRGIRYHGEHVYGAPMAKLLGTYEMELHSTLSAILAKPFRRFINVGGAEGYYAIGVARKAGSADVLVFEMNPKGREVIEKLAADNGLVDAVKVRGWCEESDLFEALNDQCRDVIIMDVEGAELKLLSSRVVDRARVSALVIEAHDHLVQDCTAQLRRLFEASHHVIVVPSRERVDADFPLRIRIPRIAKLDLMSEGRPGVMNWVIAIPKSDRALTHS